MSAAVLKGWDRIEEFQDECDRFFELESCLWGVVFLEQSGAFTQESVETLWYSKRSVTLILFFMKSYFVISVDLWLLKQLNTKRLFELWVNLWNSIYKLSRFSKHFSKTFNL